jgi:hypothetical protein
VIDEWCFGELEEGVGGRKGVFFMLLIVSQVKKNEYLVSEKV